VSQFPAKPGPASAQATAKRTKQLYEYPVLW